MGKRVKSKGKEKEKKEMMHSTTAHHPLTDAQPVPEQHSPLPQLTLPGLYTKQDVPW